MKLFSRYRWAYILLVLFFTLFGIYFYIISIQLFIGVSLAVIPIIFYISIVRFTDIRDREPRGLIALNIAGGMILIFVAMFLERWGYYLLLNRNTPTIVRLDLFYTISFPYFLFLFVFLIVGPVEEGLKFIMYFIINYRNKEIDLPADPIIYTTAIAGGFALFENYKYVINAMDKSIQYGYALAMARLLTAIPLHLGLGLLSGLFISKFTFNSDKKIINFISALFLPIIIHGLYDFLVFSLGNSNNGIDIISGFLFSVFLSIIAWKLVINYRKSVIVNLE